MNPEFRELDYNLHAENYLIFQEFQQAVAKQISKYYQELGTEKELNILEIGSGEGATTSKIINLVPNSEIICVDIDSVLIQSAKNGLNKHQDSLTFVNADIFEYLPKVEDNYFDVIASCYTIHNFEEAQRRVLLKNIYSKLKIGGIFVNGDNYALDNDQDQFRACMWTINQFIKMYIDNPELQYKWIKHRFRDESIKWTETNAINDFQKAGFVDVRKTYRARDEQERPLIESVIIGKK